MTKSEKIKRLEKALQKLAEAHSAVYEAGHIVDGFKLANQEISTNNFYHLRQEVNEFVRSVAFMIEDVRNSVKED